MASQKYLPNLTKTDKRKVQIETIKLAIGTKSFADAIDFSLGLTTLFCRATEKFEGLRRFLLALVNK